MSKGSGMGRKRIAEKISKGLDKCDASSHSKQCGNQKNVTKGNKHWHSKEKNMLHQNPFYADIFIPQNED